jgi:hypothetical protein
MSGRNHARNIHGCGSRGCLERGREQIEIPRGTAPCGAKRKEIGVKEYKVLTQKDRFFGGKFDPERLEKAINSYATEGWSVVSVATASIPSLTGTREEMIVVMEQEN